MAVIAFPPHSYPCGCQYNGLSNTIKYCKTHGTIIKTGEDRKRSGQRNTKLNSEPGSKPRTIQSKHPLSRLVTQYLSASEMDKFMAMKTGDTDEWDRISEIQNLSLEQLKDEAGYQFQRIGRQNVDPWASLDNSEEMWQQLSPEQLALQESIDIFMLRLTPKQQEVMRYRYWQNLSQRDTAERLGQSKKTIETDEKNAKNSLLKKFREEWLFVEPEVVLEAG